MKQAAAVVLALLAVACVRPADSRAPDWTLTTFRQRFWHGSCAMTLPTVSDGVVYLGGGYPWTTGAFVQAFDLETDSEIWRFEVGETFFTGSQLLLDGDTLYVGAGDRLLALDRRRGTQRWSFGIAGRERVARDGVVYTSSGTTLVALDAASGGEVWRVDLGEQLRETPVLLGDRIYVEDAGSLLILDRASGARIESDRQFTGVARLRAIGGRLWFTARIAGAAGRATLAWNPDDGTLAVHDGEIVGSGEGIAYVAAGDSLRLIDAAADAEIARYDRLPSASLGGVVVDGGTMFQPDLTGRVRALNAFDLATGRREWTFEAGGMLLATPVLAADRLWVASDDCRLYAFDLQ